MINFTRVGNNVLLKKIIFMGSGKDGIIRNIRKVGMTYHDIYLRF